MMLDLSPGWTIEVDRGPNWLFVQLHADRSFETEDVELADPVWQLMQQHFAHRVVLEMDDVPVLHSRLVGQLVQLQKRVESEGGLLRLSGLADNSKQVLRSMHIADRFPYFETREAAVMGDRPAQPR